MPSVWFAHRVPDTRVLGKREVEVPRQASEPERACNAAASATGRQSRAWKPAQPGRMLKEVNS